MLVLVNGLPLFSEQIVKDLNSFDRKNKYVFLDTYYSKLDQLIFLILLPFSNTVISFNGVTDNSGSLNWVIRLKKRLIMQWHGTDVMLAQERQLKGTIIRKYIDYADHFTDASWLANELNPILKKKVKIAEFKYIVNIDIDSLKIENIDTLIYLGKGREEFYGLNHLLKLAQDFKNVTFHVIGSDGEGIEKLANLQFYGWVDKYEKLKLFEKSSIFLRLTEHDGLSLSVLEALGFGCEVIWSYPFENCLTYSNYDELNENLSILIEKIKNRGLVKNCESSLFIKKHFNRKIILSNYHQLLGLNN